MVTGRPSLVLEPKTGACFVLAARLRPQKEEVPPKQHFLAVLGVGKREDHPACLQHSDPKSFAGSYSAVLIIP